MLQQAPPRRSILDALVSAGQPNAAELIDRSGFAESLSGDSAFTLFIIGDEFVQFVDGGVRRMVNLAQELRPETRDAFVQSMIVPGKHLLSDLETQASTLELTSLNGLPYKAELLLKTIVAADIQVGNGVVHVVNHLVTSQALIDIMKGEVRDGQPACGWDCLKCPTTGYATCQADRRDRIASVSSAISKFDIYA